MGDIGKHLRAGQAVKLESLEFGFQITAVPDGQPGHQVLEVGADYVVVEDPEAGVKTRIPVHLLKLVAAAPAQPAPQAA